MICEPLRTPVGGFGGTLRDVPAHELAATVIRALLERTGLPGDVVDEVVLGHSYPTMDAPAIGRVAALDAGLPVTTTGIQIDRRCRRCVPRSGRRERIDDVRPNRPSPFVAGRRFALAPARVGTHCVTAPAARGA